MTCKKAKGGSSGGDNCWNLDLIAFTHLYVINRLVVKVAYSQAGYAFVFELQGLYELQKQLNNKDSVTATVNNV